MLVALVVLAGIGYAGFFGVKARLASTTIVHQTWFAPYVDVTLTPTYQFQSTSADTARQSVLGFVVAGSAPVARRAGVPPTRWPAPTSRSR